MLKYVLCFHRQIQTDALMPAESHLWVGGVVPTKDQYVCCGVSFVLCRILLIRTKNNK